MATQKDRISKIAFDNILGLIYSTQLNMNKMMYVAFVIIGLVMILPASRIHALNDIPIGVRLVWSLIEVRII